MALFLNPLSERSRLAVQKLEALSSVDFAEDMFNVNQFQMGKIPSIPEPGKSNVKELGKEIRSPNSAADRNFANKKPQKSY